MFINISFIVFRLINFAIISGIGYWIYRKYFKVSFDEEVNQKEAVLKGLEEQGYFLEGKLHNLEEQFADQEIKATVLRQKIDDWKAQVKIENAKRHEEYQYNNARAAQKILLKNSYIQQTQWRINTITPALKEAEFALLEKFSNPDEAHRYLHEIIENMEKQ